MHFVVINNVNTEWIFFRGGGMLLGGISQVFPPLYESLVYMLYVT